MLNFLNQFVMADNRNFNGVAVQRYFVYQDDSIIMYSRTVGEFGMMALRSWVRFYSTFNQDDEDGRIFLDMGQNVDDRYDFDTDVPLEFRVGEMNYLLSISLLFNPKNITEYGIPKESATSDL